MNAAVARLPIPDLVLPQEGITAESFEALARIAMKSVEGKRNLHVVCGPLTTGGTGVKELNFAVFNAAIRGLEMEYGKEQVFDQMPYEYGLRLLAEKWAMEHGGYCWPILHTFYGLLFETGAFGHGWFTPGWDTSTGAREELKKLSSVGCNLHIFVHQDIRKLLRRCGHPESRIERIMALLPKGQWD